MTHLEFLALVGTMLCGLGMTLALVAESFEA